MIYLITDKKVIITIKSGHWTGVIFSHKPVTGDFQEI
jgi:hypothetical protein